MRDHGEQNGGSAGLTDHATPDLNGTVIPRQFVVLNAGKDKKRLSQGLGAEPPRFSAVPQAPPGFPSL
jgi:hypothetical protein